MILYSILCRKFPEILLRALYKRGFYIRGNMRFCRFYVYVLRSLEGILVVFRDSNPAVTRGYPVVVVHATWNKSK